MVLKGSPPVLGRRALEYGVISGVPTAVGRAWVSQVAERRREGTQTGLQEGTSCALRLAELKLKCEE